METESIFYIAGLGLSLLGGGFVTYMKLVSQICDDLVFLAKCMDDGILTKEEIEQIRVRYNKASVLLRKAPK